MPILLHYISSYTGFATRDDAYDVMLETYITTPSCKSCSRLCFRQPPTAADDDDFLNFSQDDVFFIHISVL